MQLEYYISNTSFMKWLESNSVFAKYTKLNDELQNLKYYFYNSYSKTINQRIEIDELENKIKMLLDSKFNQYYEESKQQQLNDHIIITKLDRIENNLSQQTFAPKATKHKISWGVCDKDANPDVHLKQLKFKINKQEYVLEYKRDISVELNRTPIKKIGMKKNKDGTLGVNFYKKSPKERMIPKHYIFLMTNGESKIVSEKVNDVWILKTQTNDLIVKKINKFIKDNNL